MAYNNGLVTKGVENFPSTGDIQQALGDTTGSGDIGVLCLHPNLNICSKYKPNAAVGFDQPSDAILATNRYFLAAVATNNRNALATMAMGWTYHGAQAPYYRQLDFDRYYNGAPIPFKQANGQTLLVDLVSGNANPALFYMLMSGGALANKAFSPSGGIDTHTAAVPSNRLAYCISVEDLGFDSGGGTYHSLMGAVLGLVIFQGTTYKGEVFSSVPVAELSTIDNDMFKVSTNGLDLAPGTYTAVACGKVTDGLLTYYLPVYNDANYPARFTLNVGSVDYYKQDRIGLAETSGAASVVTMLTTVNSDIYVRMRLYNQTGHDVTLNVRDYRFVLSTQVTGTVTDQSGTHSIDRTQTSQLAWPTSDVNVVNGGYAEFDFRITNIWSNSAGSSPSFIESGNLTVIPSLQFSRGGTLTPFPLYGIQRLLSVTYGL